MGSYCIACLDCKEFVEAIKWLGGGAERELYSDEVLGFLHKHRTWHSADNKTHLHRLIIFNDRVAMDEEWEYYKQYEQKVK